MSKLNPYDELGVPKDADDSAIKNAYRQKAKKAHPDQGGNRDDFDRLQRSYLILSDPDRRDRYDQTGSTEDKVEKDMSVHILVTLFNEMIELDIPLNVNYVDIMKEMINKKLGTTEKDLAEFERKLKKLNKVRTKLKRKKQGTGLLESVVDGKMRELKRNKVEAENFVRDLKRARDAVEDYTFTPDEEIAAEDIPPNNPFHNFFKLAVKGV